MASIFQERLIEAMNVRGYTQTKLAKASGLSKPLICRYLQGEYKASNTNLVKLSNALNVNPGWLLGLSIEMQKKEDDNTPSKQIIQDIVNLCVDQDEATLKTILKVIKSIVE